MPRVIEITAPAKKADVILRRVEGVDGVVGMARQRGAALQPPGDIVSLQTTNDGTRFVLEILDDLNVLDGAPSRRTSCAA